MSPEKQSSYSSSSVAACDDGIITGEDVWNAIRTSQNDVFLEILDGILILNPPVRK